MNPEREIQPFVVNLTGINSKMLQTAPKFYEVAKRIVEITEDCIIVAHNSEFDYRILRTEFNRLGFDYKRKSLCTVELAKQLMPEQESYSLGKLTRSLGIPVSDRHRASGDALATVKLFKMILAKDLEKTIIQETIKSEPKYKLEPNLKSIISELPSTTGIYYIHNTQGTIIYLGKSKNIKSRVNQHFTGTDGISKKIQSQVAAVTYELTGNELVAMLKENEELTKNKPVHNRSLKRSSISYGLYHTMDKNGYLILNIQKINKEKQHITTFNNMQSGRNFLFKTIEQFKLCQKLTNLYDTKGSCFKYDLNECLGACIQEEVAVDYNQRVQEVIDTYSFEMKNLAIVDRGRDIDERSVILIENGIFTGLGFYNLNHQITKLEVLKNVITSMENHKDTHHVIQAYLRKNNRIKIIELNSNI